MFIYYYTQVCYNAMNKLENISTTFMLLNICLNFKWKIELVYRIEISPQIELYKILVFIYEFIQFHILDG